MAAFFFYGTLQHLPLLNVVLGRTTDDVEGSPAVLHDFGVFVVQDQIMPVIRQEHGAKAEGILVGDLGPKEQQRLAYYMGAFGFEPGIHSVELADGSLIEAQAFNSASSRRCLGETWVLDEWAMDWAEVSVIAAQEIMEYEDRISAGQIAGSVPSIRTRAWAKLAARQRLTGDSRDPSKDVVVHDQRRPYVGYFGIEEASLQHRQHDGSMGPLLNRSGLMQGSAVIVLPYDPVRDTVLLVEQFRAPVFLIDDPEPWMWEPVAGMIDPGETPEQAALREAEEEAQVKLDRLEYAGGAYSSSGSSTEYVYLYVGLADLTKTIENGGLASEGEDIRTDIFSFSEFMDRVDGHGFKDLPLLTLALWLARHRDRLRG